MAILALEIPAAILSFDIMFLADLAMDNLFFVFGFAVAGFMLGGCRKLLRNFVLLITVLFCTIGVTQIGGVNFFPSKNTLLFFGAIVIPLFVLGAGTRLEKHTRKIIVSLMVGLSFAL